jgi:hypothetical protein
MASAAKCDHKERTISRMHIRALHVASCVECVHRSVSLHHSLLSLFQKSLFANMVFLHSLLLVLVSTFLANAAPIFEEKRGNSVQ